MSYRLSGNIIGAEEFAAAMRRAPQVTTREFSRAIGNSAFRVEALAKQKAPIEYGNLRGSINTRGPKATANNVEASVGTNMHYARYQEEGTGLYGPRKQPITPKSGKFLVFTVGGKKIFAKSVRGVRPKRYFRGAKEEATPFFTDQMKGALARIVTHLARG